MNFYKKLKAVDCDIKDVLADENYFVQFPGNWHIIVSDIVNSTEAVEAGKHDDVNLIAAGSLIAALNVTKTSDTEIPYFFGGDGGTVIVPEALKEKVLEGLNAHRLNSLKNFSLNLRIGSISIKEVMDAGHQIKVAKVLISDGFTKSIVIGNGLKYAEKIIKKGSHDEQLENKKEGNEVVKELNMEGLECRWDRIKPPEMQREVVCFLVDAIRPEDQLKVYREVLIKLDEIYGDSKKRHPVSVKNLRLLNKFKKIQREMMVRYGKKKIAYIAKAFLQTLIGKYYFKYNIQVNNLKGKDYLEQLIAFSEILTIDGRINTIVSGTKENRIAFIEYLNKQEQSGMLIYGHYVSPESIMTCYIENRKDKHTHFLDGSNGGYTEAAKELKQKIKAF